MLKTISKLDDALDALNGVFIGVAEQETDFVYAKRVVHLILPDGGANDIMAKVNAELPRGTQYTKIAQEILKGGKCRLGLSFTDSGMDDVLQSASSYKIIRIINMEETRHGRTIFEIEARGQRIVLKAVNTIFKEAKLFSILYYMKSIKDEDLKQIKEIYDDDLKQNDIEIINYVC